MEKNSIIHQAMNLWERYKQHWLEKFHYFCGNVKISKMRGRWKLGRQADRSGQVRYIKHIVDMPEFMMVITPARRGKKIRNKSLIISLFKKADTKYRSSSDAPCIFSCMYSHVKLINFYILLYHAISKAEKNHRT